MFTDIFLFRPSCN